MKKNLMISIVLLGILFAGGISLAFDGFDREGGYGHHRFAGSVEEHSERQEHRMAMMTEMLDLSQEQQDQIKQILTKHFEEHQGQREQMHQNREALREQLRGDDFDEQSFRTLAGKQGELQTDMWVARAKMKQQIQSILTPEQQEKAEKLQELRKYRHHGRPDLD